MNKSNGGKQQKQKDMIVPNNAPAIHMCGHMQKMMTDSDEMKGLKDVLEERGFSVSKMWAKCLPVCPFENTDCCMVCLLSHQGDCHAPSWLDPGEPSHTRIHLTMDHDSTQLNASPRMGNVEYSLTWTSPTSTDISRQAGMACCKRDKWGRAAPKSQLRMYKARPSQMGTSNS